MASDFSVSALGLRPLDLTLRTDVLSGTEAVNETQKGGFVAAIETAGNGFVSSLERAEGASIRGMTGEATAYEVASAVMEAEQSLRSMVAIRDKIVSAYLEISRMQI